MPRFLKRDRQRLMYIAGLLAGFVISALGVMAQGTPDASGAQNNSPVPQLSVTTHEVLMDVTVTDASGHPVTGLTASDFTISEEGAPQTLKRIREHQPMTAAEVAKMHSAPALPVNTFTNYTP